LGVRWYVAYPMSDRQLEEMMGERGLEVDHSTLIRWILKYVPLLEKEFAAHKRLVGSSWRVDETYVRIKGEQHYLWRAVDQDGVVLDVLVQTRRSAGAAK
jgi:putative transposase